MYFGNLVDLGGRVTIASPRVHDRTYDRIPLNANPNAGKYVAIIIFDSIHGNIKLVKIHIISFEYDCMQ